MDNITILQDSWNLELIKPRSRIKRFFKMIKSKLRIGNMFGRKERAEIESIRETLRETQKERFKLAQQIQDLNVYKTFYELSFAGYHCMLLCSKDADYPMKEKALMDAGYVYACTNSAYPSTYSILCKPQTFQPYVK